VRQRADELIIGAHATIAASQRVLAASRKRFKRIGR